MSKKGQIKLKATFSPLFFVSKVCKWWNHTGNQERNHMTRRFDTRPLRRTCVGRAFGGIRYLHGPWGPCETQVAAIIKPAVTPRAEIVTSCKNLVLLLDCLFDFLWNFASLPPKCHFGKDMVEQALSLHIFHCNLQRLRRRVLAHPRQSSYQVAEMQATWVVVMDGWVRFDTWNLLNMLKCETVKLSSMLSSTRVSSGIHGS